MAHPTGQPLSEAERGRIEALRAEKGEEHAARILGISKHTFARAAAGFGLLRGTRLLIRTRLAELPDREAA
jgi:hypothetical protein